MTAVNVTNNHTIPVHVGKVTINPGRTAAVANWNRLKTTEPYQTWLGLGVLAEEGASPSPQAPEVVADPSVNASDKPLKEMTKVELVVYAKANGIDADGTKDEVLSAIRAAEEPKP